MIGNNFNISQQIAERVARVLTSNSLRNGADYLEIIEILKGLSGKFDGWATTFYYHEYMIQVGNSWWLNGIAQTLEKLRPFSLSVAPELVTQFSVDNDKTVLVARYTACANEQLIRVDSFETAFNEGAIKIFQNEMKSLADRGFVHTYIRGGLYWMVGNKTGTIVLTAWHSLEEGSPHDCAYMLRTIDHVFQWQEFLNSKK